MNAEQRQNFLNLIKAVSEHPMPKMFNMQEYGYDCGTPACILGTYADRSDLQNLFFLRDGSLRSKDSYAYLDFDSPLFAEHFGLDNEQLWKLFSHDGCDRARTIEKAVEYLKKFMEDLS